MRPAAIALFLVFSASAAHAQRNPLRTIPELPPPNARSADLAEGIRLAEAALRRRVPRMRGSVDLPKLQRWMHERLAPSIAERYRVTREADAVLSRVSEGAEAPFAAAIIGLLYADLMRVVDTVPLPREIARDPELQRAYRDAFERALEPLEARAREAFRACEERSAESSTALSAWCSAQPSNPSP